jgi:uncharacterized repeat protein (TIGR01451 family)
MGVLIGGDVTFTMTATNVGNIAATGVRLVGTLPAGLTYGNVPGRWLAFASTSNRCLQDSCVQELAGCCLLSCVFSASHSQLLAVNAESRCMLHQAAVLTGYTYGDVPRQWITAVDACRTAMHSCVQLLHACSAVS